MQRVVIIAGPTAVGKTNTAVELALRTGGEIVSADSMQIYSEMSIGTARPDEAEMRGVPHYMLGCVPPDAHYSVAAYQADALAAIESILSRGRLPIVVGGTGLYINALTCELDFTQEGDSELRGSLSAEYDEKGAETMHERLRVLDPEAAGRIHKNDKFRVVRRLELILSGKGTEYEFRRYSDRYDFRMMALTMPREMLYERINARVDAMLARGLEAEARRIYEKYGADIGAFAAIGYKEFLPYFAGETDIDEVRGLIARNSRRYAKRQITWFRRDERIKWFDITEYDCKNVMYDDIIKFI